MADSPTPPDGFFTHLVSVLGGGLGLAIVQRWTKRDGNVAAERRDTIEKLWVQNGQLWGEVKGLHAQLEECREHHRECQSKTELLEERIGRLETQQKGAN